MDKTLKKITLPSSFSCKQMIWIPPPPSFLVSGDHKQFPLEINTLQINIGKWEGGGEVAAVEFTREKLLVNKYFCWFLYGFLNKFSPTIVTPLYNVCMYVWAWCDHM